MFNEDFYLPLYTDNKENQIFLIYKETQKWSSCKVIYVEGLPNIWGNAQIFPHIWGGRQSYMALQLLHSEFPYIWGKFDFLFYQCVVQLRYPEMLSHCLGLCAPFRVARNPDVGRQLVATRLIVAGEILCQEEPLIVGPNQVKTETVYF